MRIDSRWLVTLCGNLLFLFLLGQVNHNLSHAPFASGPVYFFLLGLPVAFAALRFDLGHGLACVALTALAAESMLPIKPGVLMFTCATCFCTVQSLRPGFNRLNPSSARVVALLCNFALMLVLSVLTHPVASTTTLLRLSVDFLFSEIAVLSIAGWFFTGQLALLRVFGFDLETEPRESP